MFSRRRRSRQPTSYTGVSSNRSGEAPNSEALAAANVIGDALRQNNNSPVGLQFPPHQRSNELKRASSMLSIRRDSLRSNSLNSNTSRNTFQRRNVEMRSASSLRNRRSMSDFSSSVTTSGGPPSFRMVKKWVPSTHGLVSVEVPAPIPEDEVVGSNSYRGNSNLRGSHSFGGSGSKGTVNRYRQAQRRAGRPQIAATTATPQRKKSLNSLRGSETNGSTVEPTIPEDEELNTSGGVGVTTPGIEAEDLEKIKAEYIKELDSEGGALGELKEQSKEEAKEEAEEEAEKVEEVKVVKEEVKGVVSTEDVKETVKETVKEDGNEVVEVKEADKNDIKADIIETNSGEAIASHMQKLFPSKVHTKSQESLASSKNSELDIFNGYSKSTDSMNALSKGKAVKENLQPVAERELAEAEKPATPESPIGKSMAQQLRPTLGLENHEAKKDTKANPQTLTPPTSGESQRSPQTSSANNLVKRRSVLKNSNDSKRYSNYNADGVSGPHLLLTTAENTRLNAMASSSSLNYSPVRPTTSPNLSGPPLLKTTLRGSQNGQRPQQAPHLSAAAQAIKQDFRKRGIQQRPQQSTKPRPKSSVQLRAAELFRRANQQAPVKLEDAFDPLLEDYSELKRTSSYRKEIEGERKSTKKESRMTLRDTDLEENLDVPVQLGSAPFKSRFADSDDELDSPAQQGKSSMFRKSEAPEHTEPPRHRQKGSLARFFSEPARPKKKVPSLPETKGSKKKRFRKLRKLFGSD